MALEPVAPDVYRIRMGQANAYLIAAPDGLTLIDAGFPGKEEAVLAAVRALGLAPADLRHLILTHGHPDHFGSAAAIVRATGARTLAHALDKPLIESGGPFRPMTPAPGLLRQIMSRVLYDPKQRLAPVTVDDTVADGDVIPMAGGLEVIGVPGHSAGQVALLWRPGRVLFGADAFMTMAGVGDPIGFEDIGVGRASQRRLSELSFAAAGFGHGSLLGADGADRLRAFVAKRV